MTAAAATILRGRVIAAHVEPHPDYPSLFTVVVHLRAQETLKGRSAQVFTYRQFVWDLRDRRDRAGFRKGDEYLLLMNAPSSLGLSSPVGLEQGWFRVIHHDGLVLAVNGRGNRDLFGPAPARDATAARLSLRSASVVRSHRVGPMRVDDLQALIRELVGKP